MTHGEGVRGKALHNDAVGVVGRGVAEGPLQGLEIIADKAVHRSTGREGLGRIKGRDHRLHGLGAVVGGQRGAIELRIDIRVLFARIRPGMVHDGPAPYRHHASMRLIGLEGNRIG